MTGTDDARLAGLTGPGRLIVLSGPSGVGKDTILRELFARDPSLRQSVSYTTRAPRSGEINGTSYWFVDDATFDRMIAGDAFLEWAQLYTHRSGTAMERVREAIARGDEIILKIDVQGAARVRELLDATPLFIFVLPPSLEELRRRLVGRATEDPVAVELRRQRAVHELAEQDKYDHRVVNDNVGRAAQEILDIIRRTRG